MVQCKKCKLFLSINKDDVIRCKGECNSVFHRKCVKNMKQFLQKECCEECSKSALAVLSPKITEQEEDYREHTARPLECPTAMEDLLREVNKKLEIVHKMDKDLEDIKNSVSFYAEKYQEMVEFKQQAEKKMKSMEQQQPSSVGPPWPPWSLCSGCPDLVNYVLPGVLWVRGRDYEGVIRLRWGSTSTS
ncbi:unnamed protein product [Arctia plantaginis]|uniref:Uncharacterized protein n=1 Tax=Arctia plantaginis TaxID=874455 RepID=A0A8S1BHH2_ARCPL|nr:unnamed protein product [Arctia plantaginis]